MREQEKQSLIEEFMEEVPELAEELHDGSLPMEDLIQEGYLGIMNGIAVLAEEEEKGLYGGLGVTETIRGAIRKCTIACTMNPVLCGTSYRNKGVQPLLDAVIDYMPSPLDIPAIQGTDPNDPEKHM